MLAHRLPDRLERLEAIGAAAGPLPAAAGSPFGSGSSALRSMDADALGGAVVVASVKRV
jgi:hypothetical protein